MALRKNAKVEMIRHVPLFAELSRKELAEVASVADELDLPEGRELTVQGRPGREFFVLLEGAADVRKNGRKVASLGAGDFFGEVALVSPRPRTATVVARTPVRVLVVTERSFRSLLEHMPTVQAKVLKAVVARIEGDNL